MPKYSPNASSSDAPAPNASPSTDQAPNASSSDAPAPNASSSPEAAHAGFCSYNKAMAVHAVTHAVIAGANIFFANNAVSVISDKSSTDDYKRLAACVIAINSSIAGFSTACCVASFWSIVFANERGFDGNTARRNTTSTDGLADVAQTPVLAFSANSSAPDAAVIGVPTPPSGFENRVAYHFNAPACPINAPPDRKSGGIGR